MRDAVVVGPVLVAGAFALNGVSEAWSRPGANAGEYLAFLAVLAGVLLVWYRLKTKSAERMKALELGRDRDRDRQAPAKADGLAPAAAAVALGVGGPAAVSLVAWLTTLTTQGDPEIVWPISGLLGVTSVICGTVLLARQYPRPHPHPPEQATNGRFAWEPSAKAPVYDPDAIDLVGRRG
jgi:hypothetical protein